MFACHFGGHRFMKIQFRAAPSGDMFKRKINKIFKVLPNVFCIADNSLVVGYDDDGTDHNRTIFRVLLCRKQTLKLIKNKCNFQYTSVPFFVEIISGHDVGLDPCKLSNIT